MCGRTRCVLQASELASVANTLVEKETDKVHAAAAPRGQSHVGKASHIVTLEDQAGPSPQEVRFERLEYYMAGGNGVENASPGFHLPVVHLDGDRVAKV